MYNRTRTDKTIIEVELTRDQYTGETRWHWVMWNEQGVQLAISGNTYSRRANCIRALKTVREKISTAPIYFFRDDHEPDEPPDEA